MSYFQIRLTIYQCGIYFLRMLLSNRQAQITRDFIKTNLDKSASQPSAYDSILLLLEHNFIALSLRHGRFVVETSQFHQPPDNVYIQPTLALIRMHENEPAST